MRAEMLRLEERMEGGLAEMSADFRQLSGRLNVLTDNLALRAIPPVQTA